MLDIDVRGANSIPAAGFFLYGLQIFVPGLGQHRVGTSG